jgi:hypothetical protein
MSHWLSTAVRVYLLHPLTGAGYAWWSGAGSDLGEITIIAVVIRYLNCNEKGCWRFGYPHHGHKCRQHCEPLKGNA